MTKKHIYIASAGLIVVVACLFLVVSSIRQLPPGTIKPNAKPALSEPNKADSAMAVNSESSQQTLTTTSASVPTESTTPNESQADLQIKQPVKTNNDQPKIESDNLGNIVTNVTKPVITLSSQLQNSLLNITSGLGQ